MNYSDGDESTASVVGSLSIPGLVNRRRMGATVAEGSELDAACPEERRYSESGLQEL
jgi:hypothetical protein